MRTEVTNAQYAACVKAQICTEPGNTRWKNPAYADHPVTNVDWEQANAYARWVGGRLPTEAEWEKAARGVEGKIYPWGDQPPTAQLLNFNSQVKDTKPVGSYPDGASPYGAWDMAGNVWEWTADWYDEKYYATSPTANPKGPEKGESRTLRGGSWIGGGQLVRCAYRLRNGPDFRGGNVGFRVLSPGF
jgi:formylglycine-generating enzyme required for sulfatase activity